MFIKMKGHTTFHGEIIKNYRKFVGILKKFSKTIWQEKMKLIWKHPQVR